MPRTVVHLIVSLVHGGAERTLTRIVPDGGVAKDGTRHVVVALRDGGAFLPELTRRQVPVVTLGMEPGPRLLRGGWRLVRFLRRVRPDIMMSWLYHADLVATLTAPLCGSPRLIWNVRGTVKDRRAMRWHTRLTVTLLALLSRRPWAIATNSLAGRRDHEAIGYRPHRWRYLPNGFDTELWHPDPTDRAAVRVELGMRDEEVAVVMVARCHDQKDHATLLAAFERVIVEHPDGIRLVLVGAGTERLEIAAECRRAVHLLGDRDDVPRLLRACDVAVLSSAYGEGLPNVIGEAMATGLPSVVTDTGDAALLVGPTGWVVPPRDPEALAAALLEAKSEPEESRRLRGCDARARIVEDWSLDASRDAYRELLSER